MPHCIYKNQFAKGCLPSENIFFFNMLQISAFYCINLLWNYLPCYPCFYFVWCLFLSSVLNVFPFHAIPSQNRMTVLPRKKITRESVLHLQTGERHFEWRRRIKLAPDIGAEYQPCVFEVRICKPFPIDSLQSELYNNKGIIW